MEHMYGKPCRWNNLNTLISAAGGKHVFGLNLDYPFFRKYDNQSIADVVCNTP
jgi:hypothetical protein